MKIRDSFYIENGNCTFENDKLHREDIAKNLTYILKDKEIKEQGLILALNSEWGNGKTTFIKMWKNMLDTAADENFKIPNLYFSAWEEDYSKEPLIAILGEINRYLILNNKKENDDFNKVLKMIENIFKNTLPVVSKVITSALLNKAGINNDAIKEIIESIADNGIKELVESYSEDKEILQQLKKILKEVFKSVGADENKPFIIFIDELDRCRPTYAIEMLENIKHLFGIPNLVFVISIDKVQLSKSIQAVYGQIDTENYLRRFFDLEFILPKQINDDFFNRLNDNYGIKFNLKKYFKNSNFTLRELHQIASRIKLLEIQNYDGKFDMEKAVFILILKMFRNDLYLQIPNIKIQDVETLMNIMVENFFPTIRTSIYPEYPDIFIKYIELIYSICDGNIYEKDYEYIKEPDNFIVDRETQIWGKKDGANSFKEVDKNIYSYIVQKYYDFIKSNNLKDEFKMSRKKVDTLLEAINFISSFNINEKN